jgi:hypothetical protein
VTHRGSRLQDVLIPIALAFVALAASPIPATRNASPAWTADTSLSTGIGSLGAVAAPCHGKPSAQCVYAVGGRTVTANGLATVTMLDPATDVWSGVASMKTGRADAGVTSGPCEAAPTRTCLYAIGGSDAGNVFVASVESFDPTTGKWSAVASLPTPGAPPSFLGRAQFAAASGPCFTNTTQICVYAVGGYNPALYNLNSVQELNPRTKKWTAAAPLRTPRSRLAVATAPCVHDAAHKCLYAIGGTGTSGFLSSVEMYSPRTNTWTAVTGLHARSSSAALGLQELGAAVGACPSTASKQCIYAFGGLDSRYAILGATMVFDPSTDTWSYSSATLITSRDSLGATAAPCVGSSARCVYAVGGAGATYTPSVEQLDP